MALASVEDLAARLGRTFTQVEADRAAALIEQASGVFVGAAGGQVIEEVTETVTLDGYGARVLLLPQIPVTDVDTVEVDGDAVTAYEWSAKGILRLDSGTFADQYRSVEVTYTHGYDPIPFDVIEAVCSAAGRAFSNPEGIKQETIGAYSYSVDVVLLDAAGITTAYRYRP